MDVVYYKFERLPFETLKPTGAKKPREDRRDCTKISDIKGLQPLKSFVTKKGVFHISIRPTEKAIHAEQQRKAHLSLWARSKNITSLFYGEEEKSLFYGTPQAGDNGYLFLTGNDLHTIEMLVLMGERHHIRQHYEALLEEGFNKLIVDFRSSAVAFYPYS